MALLSRLGIRVGFALALVCGTAHTARALGPYVVDFDASTSDAHNAVFDPPDDGICDDGNGHCTLQAAVDQANADGVATTITFSGCMHLVNSGAQTIHVPVTINGYVAGTAPNSNQLPSPNNAQLCVEISHGGFTFGSGSANSTVRGLVLNDSNAGGFAAIYLFNDGGHNVIEGNFIGTDPTGMSAVGFGGAGIVTDHSSNNLIGGTTPDKMNIISVASGYGIQSFYPSTNNRIVGNLIGLKATGLAALGNGTGIWIDGGNQTIGGPTAAERNIISGSTDSSGTGFGIVYDGLANLPQEGLIQGNYIGTDASGMQALGNMDGGVHVSNTTHTMILGNLISGNVGDGIVDSAGPAGNFIQGNLIGVDVTGHAALGNGGSGVMLDGESLTLVGGTTSAERNIISGNGVAGITIASGTNVGNTIQGNYIGTDIDGLVAVPNAIGIFSYDPEDLIGGTNAGEGNVISGNTGAGVLMTGSANDVLQGNLIGTDATGLAALGNGGPGVVVDSAIGIIGGTAPGAGNVIAYNGGAGVVVTNEDADGTRISANSIFDNGGLGIDIGDDGVTANDHLDPDFARQNFPVLTNSATSGTTVTIAGSLDSKPNILFTLEFFSNDACDPSTNGEGKTFFGAQTVMTNASGLADFSGANAIALAANVPGGKFVTATATDPQNHTSEFSSCPTAMCGGPAVCGNGVREGDEECDNGSPQCVNCLCQNGVNTNDVDHDGVLDPCDNCSSRSNPDQRNSDCPLTATNATFATLNGCSDGGDVCDDCPARPDNTQCDHLLSGGTSIGIAGGTLSLAGDLCTHLPNATVTITIPQGALCQDTSISVTNAFADAFTVGDTQQPLKYALRPEDLHLTVPATVTFGWADSDFNGNGDGYVDQGYCPVVANGPCMTSVGPTCDANGADCGTGPSCKNGGNTLEQALLLKRNSVKFTKNGFDGCSGSACKCPAHEPPVPSACGGHANCSGGPNGAGSGCATVALTCDHTNNQWTFETCDFSSVFLGEPAGDLIPGGGRPVTDCIAEWAVDDPLNAPPLDSRGLPSRKQTCRDGDPLCDADGAADGVCTFRVGLCLNNADDRLVPPGLPACTPSDILTWEITKPRPTSSDPLQAANAIALRDAVVALGPSTVGGNDQHVVAFTPPFADGEACTSLVDVMVALKGPNHDKLARASISARATTSPPSGTSSGVRDTDKLMLVCLPPA